MFVYFITATIFPFVRFLGPVYRLLIWLSARQLQQQLSRRTSHRFSLSITYARYQPEIVLIAGSYQTRDWKPQFRFCVHNDKRGVILDSLKFPSELRFQGLGTYCVSWLKLFCRFFGFSFIVLGAYPEAEGFWHKLGFTQMDYQQWSTYWH
jgi:hypothetical protein